MSLAVTVVIPVYEQVTTLRLTLEFLRLQDVSAGTFEVVVVDDGSTTPVETQVVVEHYNYPLRILRQPTRGRAAARTSGVRAASGELILFCDGDRFPDAMWVSTHLRRHERADRVAVVGTPWDCFLPSHRIEATPEGLTPVRRHSRVPEYLQVIRRAFDGATQPSVAWAAFLVGNASARRDDVIAAGGFDERLTTWGIEHFDLALRLAERGVTVALESASANYHVPHARDRGRARAGVEACVRILAPHAPRVLGLRAFLLGELSLQEFEQGDGGLVGPDLAAAPPLYFRGLSGP